MLKNLNDFNCDSSIYNVHAFRKRRNKYTRYNSMDIARELNLLIFIHKGRIQFRFKDNSYFYANTNDIVYIPKGSRYQSTYYDNNTEITSIEFLLRDSEGEFTLSDSIELMPAVYASRFESYFLAFHKRKLTNNSTFYTMQRIYLLFEALNDTNYENFNDPKYLAILPAVAYLSEHFSENISISEIARIANVSECYFRRLFKMFFHVSPIVYRNQIRLSYVDELMDSKRFTVSEAAAAAGFEDLHYYYRLKKRMQSKEQ